MNNALDYYLRLVGDDACAQEPAPPATVPAEDASRETPAAHEASPADASQAGASGLSCYMGLAAGQGTASREQAQGAMPAVAVPAAGRTPRTRAIKLRHFSRALPDWIEGSAGPACRWPPRDDMRGFGVPADALPPALVPWSAAGWMLRSDGDGGLQMRPGPGCQPVRGEELRRRLDNVHVRRRAELALESWLSLQALLDAADAASGGAVPGTERQTPEACLAAVRQCGLALAAVPKALKTPELCLEAVRQAGLALRFVPDALKTPELCLEAVRQNAWAMEDVPATLLTPAFCLEVVRQVPAALDFVPETQRTPAFCLEAVRQAPAAISCWRCPKTPEICMAAVRRDGRLLRWIPDPLKTPALCREAVRQNAVAAVDVPPRLSRTDACMQSSRAVLAGAQMHLPLPELRRAS